MTIPGFTAEASLYKTSEQYHLATVAGNSHSAKAAVYPQQCSLLTFDLCTQWTYPCWFNCWPLRWDRTACTGCMAACLAPVGWPLFSALGLCGSCIPVFCP